MKPFDRLDPLVQHHIVNTLGWRGLRPLQEASIEPIISGAHCLLLAPTAGGKTEAAIFPVLSRLCTEHWSGLGVLYICPLKALLNNLYQRLEQYCRMVGRRCELWHGDIGASQRRRIGLNPPDVLLTTPESLEVMLVSAKPMGREMLRAARVVIVDEIHAFAGDDRGWHLLAILERIGQLAGRELQRIGLSATVGNPDELLTWLASHCAGARRLIQSEVSGAARAADVQLDYVGTLENAAIVISRLFRGEKRLVFCDSRSRVEELGNELRRLGVSVFLSHSSLSADERRISEQAFAEAQDCVIVATSTLELGIDVGDLDRVLQIDAPWSVASFLQRLGRTGRRHGTTRNCLFLATSKEALLRAGGLLALWESGFVEPIVPPERPLHLFAQQVMAVVLQEGGLGVQDWPGWFARLPCFSQEEGGTLEHIVEHLIQTRILYSDGVRLSMGDAGEQNYGRRHFLELVSVFTSDPNFTIFHGRQELGSVDPLTFLRHQDEEQTILSMGGKNWAVTALDWTRREAFVVPVDAKGKSQWQGGRTGMSRRFAQAIHDLLASALESARWTHRAKTAFVGLREEYGFLRPETDVAVTDRDRNEVRWFTFAGRLANVALADALGSKGTVSPSPSDFGIRITGAGEALRAIGMVRSQSGSEIRASFEIAQDYLEKLKFSECLPAEMARQIVRDRLFRLEDIEPVLHAPLIDVSISSKKAGLG